MPSSRRGIHRPGRNHTDRQIGVSGRVWGWFLFY